jgi:hypothetical protein
MSTTTSRRGGSSATTLAGDPFEQKTEKNISQDQTLARRKNPEKGLSKKARVLRWEQINTATWILFDPAGPQIIVPRSHGQRTGLGVRRRHRSNRLANSDSYPQGRLASPWLYQRSRSR